MRVSSQDTLFAVARLDATSAIPDWTASAGFVSITRTGAELSIVCPERAVPLDATAERGFRMLAVEGPLDFALTGVLASITAALAEAGVSVFAISTYDTDYLLVRNERVEDAAAALRAGGWGIFFEDAPDPAGHPSETSRSGTPSK
jgi:hypothetical protein